MDDSTRTARANPRAVISRFPSEIPHMTWSSLNDFVAAIPFPRYTGRDSWWHGWNKPFDFMSAWRLYKRALNPALGFLLLGDTKIRRDPSLVMCFGLVSAGGIQEREEIKMVAALKIRGWWQGTGGPNIGTGSILSDQNWSPLLNDALILGGIHRRQQFHFFDDALSTYSFRKPNGVGGIRAAHEIKANAAANCLADLSDRPWEVQVWRQFFQEHLQLLWDGDRGCPRVLARELIGLMTFGYEARPTAWQLSFLPKGDGTGRANFATYLDALQRAGYRSKNKKALIATISHFLFGHPEAIK